MIHRCVSSSQGGARKQSNLSQTHSMIQDKDKSENSTIFYLSGISTNTWWLASLLGAPSHAAARAGPAVRRAVWDPATLGLVGATPGWTRLGLRSPGDRPHAQQMCSSRARAGAASAHAMAMGGAGVRGYF